MTNATVSNRPQRTAAIFKTIGVYLLSLLLLIFVFRNNNNCDNSNISASNTISQLEQDTSSLKQMIHLIDTIAGITKKLAVLDEQERAEKGSKAGEITKLSLQVENFYREIYQIEEKDELKNARSSMDNIFAVLKFLQGKIEMHQINLAEKIKQHAEELSKEDLSNQERLIAIQEKELQGKNNTGTQVLDLNAQLSQKDTELQAVKDDLEVLSDELVRVKSVIGKIGADLNNELNSGGTLKGWKKTVEDVKNRILALDDTLE